MSVSTLILVAVGLALVVIGAVDIVHAEYVTGVIVVLVGLIVLAARNGVQL